MRRRFTSASDRHPAGRFQLGLVAARRRFMVASDRRPAGGWARGYVSQWPAIGGRQEDGRVGLSSHRATPFHGGQRSAAGRRMGGSELGVMQELGVIRIADDSRASNSRALESASFCASHAATSHPSRIITLIQRGFFHCLSLVPIENSLATLRRRPSLFLTCWYLE